MSLDLIQIVEIDTSNRALFNNETPSSIALADQNLFKKWPRQFNSEMDLSRYSSCFDPVWKEIRSRQLLYTRSSCNKGGAPRPTGRRVRDVQFGRPAELVGISQQFVQGCFGAGLCVDPLDDDRAGEGVFPVLGGQRARHHDGAGGDAAV